jgi:integrase
MTHARNTTPSPLFSEAWMLWLAPRRVGTRPLRASTLADYESIYRRHLGSAFGHLHIRDFDGTAVARFTVEAARSGVSPKRLSNILVPLRACLRWHHRMGSLGTDPSPWFDAPARAADERHILCPAQIESLLGELPGHYRPHVAFLAYTGVRAGELRAITWDDVDLTARGSHRQDLLPNNPPTLDQVGPRPHHPHSTPHRPDAR